MYFELRKSIFIQKYYLLAFTMVELLITLLTKFFPTTSLAPQQLKTSIKLHSGEGSYKNLTLLFIFMIKYLFINY